MRFSCSIALAVVVLAVAGLGIRNTGCIAKSISPTGIGLARIVNTSFLAGTHPGDALPITVTGEMHEIIGALKVEFNSLRGGIH